MKQQPRHEHKLALRKETVRSLNNLELGAIAGGQVTTTVIPTRICPTQRICLTTATTTNP